MFGISKPLIRIRSSNFELRQNSGIQYIHIAVQPTLISTMHFGILNSHVKIWNFLSKGTKTFSKESPRILLYRG